MNMRVNALPCFVLSYHVGVTFSINLRPSYRTELSVRESHIIPVVESACILALLQRYFICHCKFVYVFQSVQEHQTIER